MDENDSGGEQPCMMASLDAEGRMPDPAGISIEQETARKDPPRTAPEQVMLVAFLDNQRATMLHKIAGLSDHDLRRRLVPSLTTLLGMIKHLAYVEQWWFQMVFAGDDRPVPWTEDDPDADFRIEADDSTEGILALYREQVARSRAIARSASLDTVAKRPGSEVSLRWIMVHMIEETARHAGHADILRELIDGVTGE